MKLHSRVEHVCVEYLKASSIGTTAIYPGKSATDKEGQCVVVYAAKATEDPAGSGNFRVTVKVMVRTPMGYGTDPSSHDLIVERVFRAMRRADLPKLLSSIGFDEHIAAPNIHGEWTEASSASDKYFPTYWLRSTGHVPEGTPNFANFNLAASGAYEIFEWHSAGLNRSDVAKHIISHAGGQTEILVNQRINGGKWNSLGVFEFENNGTVTINDEAPSGSIVIADAVRFVNRDFTCFGTFTPGTALESGVDEQSAWQDEMTLGLYCAARYIP